MSEVDEALDRVAEELYAELPGTFVAARDAHVKQARSDGDRDLAAAVKALRRPTVAAWLVNALARTDGGLEELIDLAGRLREAQSRLDGATMKSLGQERGQVVEQLTDRAVALGTDADPAYKDTASVREQVSATLGAAVADPVAEQAVRSGRLVSPLSYAGLGEVDTTDAVATPLRSVPPSATPDPPGSGADAPAAEPESATGPAPEDEKPDAAPEEPAPDQAEPDQSASDQSASDQSASDRAEPDEAALRRARDGVAAAERRLRVAEEAYAQARSRRHQARLRLEQARLELEDVEDA